MGKIMVAFGAFLLVSRTIAALMNQETMIENFAIAGIGGGIAGIGYFIMKRKN